MQSSMDFAPVMGGVLMILVLLVVLFLTALQIFVFCKIFSKAGYSWALGLLILVPLGNVIIPVYLACADWPALRELRELKALRDAP